MDQQQSNKYAAAQNQQQDLIANFVVYCVTV